MDTGTQLFSIRGLENFHIYIWLIKDLAWLQDSRTVALYAGSLALAWCAILAYFAIRDRDMEDLYMLIGLTAWLFGNWQWMAGGKCIP